MRTSRTLLVTGSAGLLSLLLLELGSCAVIRTGVVPSSLPRFGQTGIWWGDHPVFGVWKKPNSQGLVRTACSNGLYHTNSVGARDMERVVSTDRPRTIVLGDSFFEGWGVNAPVRVSNRLQRRTNIPHLNFATAHFGPYQSLLVYRHLAREYDHDTVLLSILPVNDFKDLDLSADYGIDYEYRYRPYLVPGDDGEGWQHLDHREPRMRRTLRHFSHLYHLVKTALRGTQTPPIPFSPFYSFTDDEYATLEQVLIRFAAATEGKRLAVVLIPSIIDLAVFADGKSSAPLSRRLARLAAREHFQLIDLLPSMAQYSNDWPGYFLPCDYHWSPLGNRVAAELIEQALY